MPESPQRRSKATKVPQDHSRIEYLILADQVEALNGKLYLMGGGWSMLFTNSIEQALPIQIACGAEIPWNETDDDHVLELVIRDLDGKEVAPPLSLTFKTGRPPTLEKGAWTHVPFAVRAELKFPAFGEYRVVAQVDSSAPAELAFWVKESVASGRVRLGRAGSAE